MTEEEIKEILNFHREWVLGEKGGKLANLKGADLYSANLEGADLYPYTQYESRIVADQISTNMKELFPVSWEALMENK